VKKLQLSKIEFVLKCQVKKQAPVETPSEKSQEEEEVGAIILRPLTMDDLRQAKNQVRSFLHFLSRIAITSKK
jgi:hypothetical protein